MTDDLAALDRFTGALEEARSAEDALGALGALVRDVIPVRLFTVMTIDWDAGLARRSYTSAPEEYPVSGDKPIVENAWSDTVLHRGVTFVANTIGDIAKVFPDAPTIERLGCGSVANIPVRRSGRTIGTLNLLDVEGFFDAPTVMRAERLLRLPALAAWTIR